MNNCSSDIARIGEMQPAADSRASVCTASARALIDSLALVTFQVRESCDVVTLPNFSIQPFSGRAVEPAIFLHSCSPPAKAAAHSVSVETHVYFFATL
jgi:hypothetical protein